MFIVYFCSYFACFDFVFLVLAKRLARKSISTVTYFFVPGGTLNLNQSVSLTVQSDHGVLHMYKM